jgi:diguanylate cyclase (GGDEF)-like protein
MKHQAWKAALVIGAVLVVAYFALPTMTLQNVAYSILSLGSVVGILIGVHWNRPANRTGWYLIAAAGLCFSLGDDLFSLYQSLWHVSVPLPSYADVLYLGGYPFLFAGVLRLTRGASRSFWREENVDAAIVSMGVLALSWQFLMDSYVHDPTLSTFGMLVNLAYPIMDVALVFIVLRAILFRQSRSGFLMILAAAMLTMFVADFTYDVMTLHNSYTTGNIIDALFLLEYVLVAVAALHPSVASAPIAPASVGVESVRGSSGNGGHLPVVLVAGFIAPAILVVASALHQKVNVIALGIVCIVVFALIALRLSWLVERLSRQARLLEENLLELTVAHVHRDELEANLRHQTLHDPLTGLANRMLFEDRLSQARQRSSRQGGLDAVLMIDLDDFKGVNDAHGHFVGDQLLVALAHRLEQVTRSSDTLCRFGGDEFLYLAEGLHDRSEADTICERLIGELVEPFTFGDLNFEQHASIGVVICDAPAESNAEYIRDADAAMYEAKRLRKGHHVVFTPSMHNEALSVFSLTQELRLALQKRDLTMHYQPILDLNTLGIVGFEALMRWPHAQRGWVPPDAFIPLAEQSELIVELGSFALRESVSVAETWERPEALGGAPFLTVNLSPRQLHDVNLIDMVKDVLAQSALTPDRLIFEITERAALMNIDDTMLVLNRLRNLGVALALDDFGTGYSSLSYLTMLRPEIIKIDRSFVAPPHPGHDSETLLETIVSLGHKLGITMLAEGIETNEQLEHLKILGCELGQGYLFARAMPALEVPSMLGRSSVTPH